MLYGSIAEVGIDWLFLAGFMPGVLLANPRALLAIPKMLSNQGGFPELPRTGYWLTFVAFRNVLPRISTPDADVIAACAAILPIAGAFQIFDGTQAVGCGVLRGMGRTRPAMVFNLVSYWGLGLPIGSWLALRRGWGLAGIWWGLACGLGLVAISLVLWIRARGPAMDRTALISTEDCASSAR